MVDQFPASFRQEWYVRASDDGWSNMNVPVVARLSGAYDKGLLQAALLELADRHEALRTSLSETGKGVVQKVKGAAEWVLEEVPLDGDSEGAGESSVVRAAIEEPFQLRDGSLVRARLCAGRPDGDILVISAHHAICDGWSARILWRDLVEIYRARAGGRRPALPVLEMRFVDYAAWERRLALGADADADYWTDLLADGHPRLRLGADGGADELPASIQSHRLRTASANELRRLQVLATERRTTLGRVLAAAVIHSLYPYIDEEITFGLTVSNREEPELREMVGDLADQVPVRLNVADAPTFVVLADRVHRAISDALEHRLPLSLLMALIRRNPQRVTGPGFDVQMNYLPGRSGPTAFDLGQGRIEELEPGWELRGYFAREWWDWVSPLDYLHRHVDDGVGGYLVVNEGAISPNDARRLADGWDLVARDVRFGAGDPLRRIGK